MGSLVEVIAISHCLLQYLMSTDLAQNTFTQENTKDEHHIIL